MFNFSSNMHYLTRIERLGGIRMAVVYLVIKFTQVDKNIFV